MPVHGLRAARIHCLLSQHEIRAVARSESQSAGAASPINGRCAGVPGQSCSLRRHRRQQSSKATTYARLPRCCFIEIRKTSTKVLVGDRDNSHRLPNCFGSARQSGRAGIRGSRCRFNGSDHASRRSYAGRNSSSIRSDRRQGGSSCHSSTRLSKFATATTT